MTHTCQGRDADKLYEWRNLPEEKKETNRSAEEASLLAFRNMFLQQQGQENMHPQPDKTSGDADVFSKSSARPRGSKAFSSDASTRKQGLRSIQAMKDTNKSFQSDAHSSSGFSPNPALELRWCVGYTSQPAGNMLWTADSRSIIYSCSSNVICMNPDSNHQRFFLGHTNKVVVMALGPNDSLLATCQEGKKPTIRLWEVSTGECVAMLNGHGSDVHCIDFNRQGTCIVAVGKEDKGAAKNFINLVVIWDVSQVLRGGKAIKIVEQHFEPSLIKMRYTPFEEDHLVSCGNENIHLWRIKKIRDKYELRRIVLPATIPYIMAGIKLAVGRGVVAMVIAEFFTAISGLGAIIINAANSFDTARMFVPVIVLMVLATALNSFVGFVERKVAPWQSEISGRDEG